jgi:hypothetical protein
MSDLAAQMLQKLELSHCADSVSDRAIALMQARKIAALIIAGTYPRAAHI